MWIERVALAAILLTTIGFGYFRLAASPAVWYDEGLYTVIALSLARYGEFALQVAPGVFESASRMSSGFPLIFPVAFSLKLFGSGVLAARAFLPLYIVGSVALTWILLRRLYTDSRWIAIAAAGLVATIPVLYGNGKSVLGEVPGLFFLLATLVCIDGAVSRSQTQRRWLWLLCAGISVGLCAVAKPIYIPMIGVCALAMVFSWHRFRFTIFEFIITFVGCVVPIAVWLVTQFSATDTVAAIFQYYTNPYEAASGVNTVLANARAVVATPSALYMMLVIGVWIVSIAVRWRRREKMPLVEIIAVGFAALVLINFFKMPGWHRYFFPAQMLGMVFFVPALLYVSRVIVGAVRARVVTAVIVCVMVGAQLVQLTSFSYVAQYYRSDRSAVYESFFGSLDPAARVFLYNAPEIAVFLPSSNFYLYSPVHPSWAIGASQLSVLRAGEPDFVVVSPPAYMAHQSDFTPYILYVELPKYYVLRRATSAAATILPKQP